MQNNSTKLQCDRDKKTEQKRLKIAFVVTSFPALSYTFIINQITGLIDLGHEVDIYAFMQNRDQKVIQNDVIKYDLLNRVRYLTGTEGRLKKIISSVKLISAQFRKNPLAIVKSLFVSWRLKSNINNIFILNPFLNNTYDIIHCHFGYNGNRLIFLKDILNVPFIVTFHGSDIRLVEKEKDIYKKLFTKANLVMAISDNYNRQKLIECGCNKNKIVTHHVGIDLGKFKFRACRNASNSEAIKIITVASLVEEKGYMYGIQAIAKVLRNNPKLNLEYNVVGDGELREQLKLLISQLKLNNHIHLLGPMDSAHVAEMVTASDIFLLPSVAEATPTVLMEAQAIGLPIVATRVGGIPEVVIDGKSGFLVPEGNIDALSEKLTYLIEHRQIWQELGCFGRNHIEKNYNINTLNERLVQIYQELLHKKQGKQDTLFQNEI